uniref:Major facilitator superfamily (MFS) profile domain-containing protein n=1 Tax=Mola mola TaxID=94237 RepID=A0A3Q3WJX1_MOLML
MKDYDEATAFLGQWGRFQQVVFFLLCLSIVPDGFVFSVVFLTDTPKHHCLVPEVNLTQDWLDAIIPVEVELSRCSRYRLDEVRNLSARGLVPGRDVNLTDLGQEGCVDGWSYSRDIYQSTIVTEFDLVCNEEWKQPLTSTIFFLGVLCGSFIAGQLSDRFGRKPVLFVTMAVQVIFTIIEMFSPSWTVFVIFLFFNGLGQVSNFVSGFVLGTEILAGNVRVLFSSLGVCVAFAIGYMFLPVFAYFLRSWTSLLFGLALPGLVYIPLWWFIPESPRWGQKKKAILRKAANINKVEAPEVIFEDYMAYVSPVIQQVTLWETLTVIAITTIKQRLHRYLLICLPRFTLSTGYYGLSLNTSQLHADPYISCFISAAVEVPAYISSWLALRYLRRKLSVISILILGALSLYFIQLVPQELSYLSVALEMLGKFAITTGTSLMFVYTAEIYPTVIRNTATGTCTTFSRMGGCIAPFLLKLSAYVAYLPYITLGTLALGSAFGALFLPETLGKPLPQTIQQMHKMEGWYTNYPGKQFKSLNTEKNV